MGFKDQGPPDASQEALQCYHLEKLLRGSCWQGSVRYAFLAPVTASSDPCHALDVLKWGSGWNELTAYCPVGRVNPVEKPAPSA